MELLISVLFPTAVFISLSGWQSTEAATVTASSTLGIKGHTGHAVTCQFSGLTAGQIFREMSIFLAARSIVSMNSLDLAPLWNNVGTDAALKNRATLSGSPAAQSVTITFRDTRCDDKDREYRCELQIITSAGVEPHTPSTTRVQVETAPLPPYDMQVLPASINSSVPEYTVLTFTCQGNVGLPAGSFQWYTYIGTEYTNVTNEATEISTSQDSGDDNCTTFKVSRFVYNATRTPYGRDLVVRCRVYHATQGSNNDPMDCGVNVTFCRTSQQISVHPVPATTTTSRTSSSTLPSTTSTPRTTTPASCKAGHFINANDNNRCTACPAGQYQELSNQKDCHKCPAGSATLTTGAGDIKDCQAPPGLKNTASVTLKYILLVVCTYEDEVRMSSAVHAKIVVMQSDWSGVCTASVCSNAHVTSTCDGPTSQVITSVIAIEEIRPSLTSKDTNNTIPTSEAFLQAILQRDTFDLKNSTGARLLKTEISVKVEFSCRPGYVTSGDSCASAAAPGLSPELIGSIFGGGVGLIAVGLLVFLVIRQVRGPKTPPELNRPATEHPYDSLTSSAVGRPYLKLNSPPPAHSFHWPGTLSQEPPNNKRESGDYDSLELEGATMGVYSIPVDMPARVTPPLESTMTSKPDQELTSKPDRETTSKPELPSRRVVTSLSDFLRGEGLGADDTVLEIFNPLAAVSSDPKPTAHEQAAVSSDTKTSAHEPAANSDYTMPTAHEPATNSDYITLTAHEPAANSDYIMPTVHEPAANSEYIMPTAQEPATNSDYTMLTAQEPVTISDYITPTAPEPANNSDYITPTAPEPANNSDYITPTAPEPANNSDYITPVVAETEA